MAHISRSTFVWDSIFLALVGSEGGFDIVEGCVGSGLILFKGA